jgi:hypothetical protein
MNTNSLKPSEAKYNISVEWKLILAFAILKLLVHFLTYSNFELHRDAYLYYAQSQHLAWGYIAVPPSIAVVGKIATSIFGNTVFGLRFFPAVIGALNIIIIGLAVKELGGGKIAILLASLAFILSPSYLHVNALFQPVSFNQFYWLLSCYLILLMIKRDNPKLWIWIAIVFGLGFLNKYSIVFFYAAFTFSLLISKHRHLYLSKSFLFAVAIGFVIILPNLLWQYQHNWPVMMHMAELRETQLVHVQLSDFFVAQFLMNIQAILLWFGALLILLFYKKEAQYRVFGFIYFFIILLLAAGSGKAYYTLGIYPILFVFGAYFIEKYIKKYLNFVFAFMVISMFVALYFSLSYDGIPITTFEKAEKKGAFRWEDGVMHNIPQDMSDMTGWKEISESVADIYVGLGPENKSNCDIFCDHYGQAGAVMFYGKKVNIPQPISFNGSFIFWSPDSLMKKYMIWVAEPSGNIAEKDSLLKTRFEKVVLKKTIDNQYFRENGTQIYLCEFPTAETKDLYKETVGGLKSKYRSK